MIVDFSVGEGARRPSVEEHRRHIAIAITRRNGLIGACVIEQRRRLGNIASDHATYEDRVSLDFDFRYRRARDMRRDPLDGALYIFINRRGSQIKCLYFDRSGF